MTFIEEIEKRNKALLALDMNYLRNAMPTSTDEVRLAAAHKARYECTMLPAEARHTSRHWLAERDMGRMSGDELLPEGVLPEGPDA